MESTYYLYKISNSINTKVYIGMTFRPADRWTEHKRESSPCKKLRRAMIKHGVENFNFEILCAGSEDYISELEIKLIELLNSVEDGYNIQPGGQGARFIAEKRITDTPVYVAGFWFQSDRLARRVLNINKRTYYCRKRKGTLGDMWQSYAPIRPHRLFTPCYVKGFVFPSVQIASKALSIADTTINRWIRKGLAERLPNKE